MGTAGAIPGSSAIVVNGGSLDMDGNNLTVASLTGSGTVNLRAGTLTVADTANDTLSGTIEGSGGLATTGSATLTLSGTNAYTGVTSDGAGTLNLASPLTGPLTVASNLHVTGAYSPLQAAMVGPAAGSANSSVTFLGSATDAIAASPSSLVLTWAVKNSAGSTVFSGTGASYAFTPTVAGTYTVSLYATDSDAISPTVTREFVVAGGPTVTGQATWSTYPNNVTGTTANLSVTATDSAGGSDLFYQWSVTSEPAGAQDPTFSVNDSATASNPIATFSQAGSYTLQVSIGNPSGQAATSSVTLDVVQTPTSIVVSPAPATVATSATQIMTAVEEDQFGLPMSAQPSFAWSAVSGSINSGTGVYTAPSSPGLDLVTATDATNHVSGSETIEIVAAQLDVTGRPTVSLDMPYTLNLSDPNGQITGGSVNWGDSSQNTTIPSGATSVTHAYATANTYTISASLQDSKGTHTVSISSGAAGTVDGSLAFNPQGSGPTGFQSTAIQANGEFLVCGENTSGSGYVARYYAAGSLDLSVTTALTSAQAVAVDPVANQSDIVVAGQESGQFAMVRYLSNGSVDSSFSNPVLPFTGDTFLPEQVAVVSDGQIVVAGYVTSADGTDLGVACYNANGTLDTSFGDGGGVTAGLTIATTADPCGLAIGGNGSIVVAGTVGTAQPSTNPYSFGVARFTSDGTLDTSFDGSGVAIDGWGDEVNHATSVAIQSDGAIVVAGYDGCLSDDDVDLDLVRFLPNGSLDTNFGVGGQINGANQPAGAAWSVALQPNNMIVVGGAFAAAEGDRMDFGLARFNVNGTIDDSFGTLDSGVATQDLGGANNSAVAALAIQTNGEIVAAGVTGAFCTGSNTGAALDRYNAGQVAGAVVRVDSITMPLALSDDSPVSAGTSDTLTLGDGWTDLGSGSNVVYTINWGDGQGGTADTTTITAANLAAAGDQVTHTFTAATTGITVDVAVNGQTPVEVGSLAVTVDFTDATTTSLTETPSSTTLGGTITLKATVAADVPATGTPSGTVEFYDGTIDLGSGTLSLNQGSLVATLTTPPLTLGDHGFTAVYNGDGTFSQSTSAPVTATSSPPSGGAGALALTAPSSATAGANYTISLPLTDSSGHAITKWAINWDDGSSDSLASSGNMATDTHVYQAAGDYLIQAIATSSAGNFSAMLDKDAKPSQESSFGSASGAVSGMTGSLSSLAVQPDGSIAAIDSGAASPIVRFNTAGQPDGTTFDSVSATIPTITAVAVQPVGGSFEILAAGSGYSVARFNSDGSLDTSFGNDGIATVPSLAAEPAPSQMLVQADGDIVLVGIEPVGRGNDDLVLARFTPAGQLDMSFDGDGIATFAPNPAQAIASCAAVAQAGNCIVAAINLPSSASTEVLRITSAGQLDSSFGAGGTFTTTAVKSNPLLALQADGEIDLVGGNGTGGYALQQYTANGGGSAEWTTGAATGQAEALAVQPSGRVVVAVDTVSGQTNAWRLAGFTSAGAADSIFDQLGQIMALTGSTASLAVQSNGDILLGGQDAADAFFADYGADSAAVAVAAPTDVAPTGLSVSVSAAAYSGADTDNGSGTPNPQIQGSFTDPGTVPQAHLVTINWGDGSTPATLNLAAGQTTFDDPLPQYAASGTYTVTVTVADADGTNATQPASVTVNYTNSQPSGLSLSLDQSTVTAGDSGPTLSGSFTDPQTNFAHTVTITWGDVTPVTTLSVAAGQSTFQADPHSYATAGNYTISATVTGVDGTTGTATTSVTVSPVLSDVMIESDVPTASESEPTPGDFMLTRDGSTTIALTVYYSIDLASTGQSGVDFQPLAGSVTFAAGSSSENIPVTPLNAGKVGGSVTVQVDLSSNANYTVDSDFENAMVTIYDDDLPTVGIVASQPNATESGTPGQFTVTRNGPTSDPLLVDYTVGGNNATNGVNYVILDGDVIIPAGSSSAAIAISPIDTGLVASSGSVVLSLAAADEYNVSGTQGSATVTLAYNDLPMVSLATTDPFCSSGSSAGYTVSRTGPTSGSLTVPYAVTINGTQNESGNVTIPAGATSEALPLSQPTGLSPGSSAQVSLTSPPPGTAVLNPATGATTATATAVNGSTIMESVYTTTPEISETGSTLGIITVELSQAPGVPVTVGVTLSGSAYYETDYTIPASENGSYTVTDNGDGTCTVSFAFSASSTQMTANIIPVIDMNAAGSTQVVAIGKGSGHGTGGVSVVPDTSNATITIADDLPSVTIGDAVAVEGDNETFNCTLSSPESYPITVNYGTVPGSALDGTDYTGITGEQLTFPANTTTQTITVPTLLDANNTSSLNYQVELSPNYGASIARSYATGIIEGVQGMITIYNANGTPSNGAPIVVGGSGVPMNVRLTSPDGADGEFAINYNLVSSDYLITWDKAGGNVLQPDAQTITPSTAGTDLYLWGTAPTDDSGVDTEFDQYYCAAERTNPQQVKVSETKDPAYSPAIQWVNTGLASGPQIVSSEPVAVRVGQNIARKGRASRRPK